MKYGLSLFYVQDVVKTMDFYEKAFGLEKGFLDETKEFGSMQTGSTMLSFVDESMVERCGYTDFHRNRADQTPGGFELMLLTKDVQGSYDRAVEAGAISKLAPQKMPWGQVVGYVFDCNGILISIGEEMDPPEGCC